MIAPRDCVYFVRDPATGRVKIGCTYHLKNRLYNLRRQHPGLELLATAPGGRRAEAALHDLVKAHHVGHEWFEPHETVLALALAVREQWVRPNDLPRVPNPFRSEASRRAYATRRARQAARINASDDRSAA